MVAVGYLFAFYVALRTVWALNVNFNWRAPRPQRRSWHPNMDNLCGFKRWVRPGLKDGQTPYPGITGVSPPDEYDKPDDDDRDLRPFKRRLTAWGQVAL